MEDWRKLITVLLSKFKEQNIDINDDKNFSEVIDLLLSSEKDGTSQNSNSSIQTEESIIRQFVEKLYSNEEKSKKPSDFAGILTFKEGNMLEKKTKEARASWERDI
jgi:hypothetical protein